MNIAILRDAHDYVKVILKYKHGYSSAFSNFSTSYKSGPQSEHTPLCTFSADITESAKIFLAHVPLGKTSGLPREYHDLGCNRVELR